ncbi:MAG: BMP family ABC transporter substrate-binding protein [Chloroflexi bacterium OHK40]
MAQLVPSTPGARRPLAAVATLLGLALVVTIGAFGGQPTADPPRPIVTVGLALATGDIGDRAFNDSAYAGLQQAQRELGVRFRVTPFRGRGLQADTLRALAQERPDLVIAIGGDNAPAVAAVAAEYPGQAFAIVDARVDAPNVTSLVFRELEGDFLAGALTALLSPDGVVGFLGGADVPVIRRIEHGWRQGVLYVRPDARILSQYISGPGDFSGFAQPDRGRELTEALFAQGAAVVYTPAGGSALGAIEAARSTGRLVITTGTDQRWLAPEAVVTSRTKNMDTAVLGLVREAVRGTLQPGQRQLDLFTGGVGLAPLDGVMHNGRLVELVPLAVRARLGEIRDALVARRIPLTEYTP